MMGFVQRVKRVLRKLFSQQPRQNAVEEYFDSLDIDALKAELDATLNDDEIPVLASLLLRTATLRSPELRISPDRKKLAETYHLRLHQKWLKQNVGGTAAVFPPYGIVVHLSQPEESFKVTLSTVGTPDWDWAAARQLLDRVDRTAQLAKTQFSKNPDRVLHMEGAYALTTQILAAVRREGSRRERSGRTLIDPPTEGFGADVELIRPQVEYAEQAFARAAEQQAQNVYVYGLFVGALILALACGLGAVLFNHYKIDAANGAAFVGGGLGAVLSVLQRTTSGSLEIDYQASSRRIFGFGALRPWIGALFGLVLYAILESSIAITAVPPKTDALQFAFFGVLGFLAGFNERFAQDVVTGATARLSATIN